MNRRTIQGGAALILNLSSNVALCQEVLPAIDIGAASRPVASGPADHAAREPRTASDGYIVQGASTGTKTDTPLREIPATINVVPKQVIVDQQALVVQDALENVSGVRSNNNELEGYNFTIRGFESRYIYRNNLALPGPSNPGTFDTANLERIEVLKGPASILYGRAEPGGLINLITKRPLDTARFVVEQQIGSFDHYRTQWDFSSPVAEAPGLAYRISGAYQNNGSFRAFQGGESLLIAPVVTYRPSDWTEFTIDGQYQGQRAQSDIGVPTIGPRPAPIPLERSFQEANDPRDRVEGWNIGYQFRQNLDENWKLTNRFHYADTPRAEKPMVTMFCAYPFCVDSADMRTLPRIGLYQATSGRTFSTNVDLEGKFTAFEGRHRFLFGLDYMNSLYNYYFGDSGTAPAIDIYNPVYGLVSPYTYWAAEAGAGFKAHSTELFRQKGFYVQDQITWLDRLHVMLGARYDVADNTRGSVFSFGGDFSATKDAAIADRHRARTRVDTAWSPRAGIVYDLLPELSVYGSYSRSFGGNNGFDSNQRNLGPQHGVQWELGLKAEPLIGLTATLAVFQITKSGVPMHDFASADPFAQKLAGLQRSRGVDVDIIGKATDRLTVMANYEYLDAKVISDNFKDPLNPFGSGLLGNHLQNAPRHSGKVFLTYDFGENGLGWRLGGGVTATSHAWGDIWNTFLIPGWARLDGFASYTTSVEGHRLTAQLNLQNVTNTRYFSGVDNYFNWYSPPFSALPAKPFAATGTIRFEW